MSDGGRCNLRLVSLVCLFVQNAGLVVLMRYTRTRTDRPMFLATTAVVVDESCKLTLSILMVTWHWFGGRRDKKLDGSNALSTSSSKTSGSSARQDYVAHWRKILDPGVCLRMSVPALVYAVQKNLLYVALSNLDACVYQAVYTGKHVTTAVFSYFILGRVLSRPQQVALVVLMFGVALVQISEVSEVRPSSQGGNTFIGFVSVALACCTSGFASVYLEYFIKNADYWSKQVQLALPALCCSLLAVLAHDAKSVHDNGFFQGYDGLVVLTIFFEVAGGLLVACVTKYADSIVKNISIALSLTAITAASALIWNFHLSRMFILGAITTVGAAYMYTSNPPGVAKDRRLLPPTPTAPLPIV